MTHEEMREAIQQVGVLLDDARHSRESWREIGTAQGMLANVLAALKAEKPLAEGWLYAISRTIPKGTIYGATFSAYNPDWADQQRIIILEEAAR